MSGSGGYYKYRCKYWLTHNCAHWVWVNNAPCAHCLAEGRDAQEELESHSFRSTREVFVPQFENGFLQYAIMEIIAVSEMDSGWAVKWASLDPTPISTGPTAVSYTALDGFDKSDRSQGTV